MLKKDKVIVIGEGSVTLDQVVAVAKGKARVKLSTRKEFLKRMKHSQNMLKRAMRNGVAVYGVNTGFGRSCGKRIPSSKALLQNANPLPFHGCGTGEPIGTAETRAAMLARMVSLASGYSGVSVNLLRQLETFLNVGITPIVPSEGSVGASGDLTPLSYVAACLAGERDVFFRGHRIPAKLALKKLKLKPYIFEPKEPLSMVNGTSTMTGIAIMVVERAWKILHAAICASALTVHAFKGKVSQFHPVSSQAKPFPGQGYIVRCLRYLLYTKAQSKNLEEEGPDALQDPYSIRCTPQILGLLYDALIWIKQWVEIEINSSNDNPIFDPKTGVPVMCGNFYGGHIAFAMDSLKAALASIADISDRQIMLLVNPQLNRGLPEDLVGVSDGERFYHHGFKAMSISASALSAEALKETMPAASFSRSCESHNQDKVSLGTIAARSADRVCTLVERVIAIHLLAASQACELRGNLLTRPKLISLITNIRSFSKKLIQDRPMDKDIESVKGAIANSELFSNILRQLKSRDRHEPRK